MDPDTYEGKIALFFLLHFIGAAMLWDIMEKRIPNEVIITGLSLGAVYQLWCFGWMGLLIFLSGVMLPVVLLGFLYYFRMIGAGDIKLFCVIGGFLGPTGGIHSILDTFLIGGAISLLLFLKRRNLFSRLCYFKQYLFQYLETRQWKPYMEPEDEDSHLYFSIPIFLSVLIYVVRMNGGD